MDDLLLDVSHMTRFCEKIKIQDGCWVWTASTYVTGYGIFGIGGKTKRAHRIAYRNWVGPIDDGLNILHRCDNRRCVNPEHLYAGTQRQNVKDAFDRGGLGRGADSHAAKLSDHEYCQAIQLWVDGESQRSIADLFGVHQSTICNIVRGRKSARF